PVEKFECEISVGDDCTANFFLELRRAYFFRSCVAYQLEARAVFAEPQLKSFIRICKCIADQWPILHQSKRNHDVILTKLSLQIDLLARLEHANRIENVFRGRRRRRKNGAGRQRKAKDEARIASPISVMDPSASLRMTG